MAYQYGLEWGIDTYSKDAYYVGSFLRLVVPSPAGPRCRSLPEQITDIDVGGAACAGWESLRPWRSR
jgi:hypothetical protein